GYAALFALLCVAPVFFAKGLSATFVHPMVLTFALAVIASTVVVVTITPALGMLLLERAQPRQRAKARGERMLAAYERVVNGALAVPRPALAGVCCLGLAGLLAVPFLGQPARPTFKDRNLVIQWQGPTSASLNEMDRITRHVVSELRALPSVAGAGATLGRAVSADQIVD